jgi:hypothetical protein
MYANFYTIPLKKMDFPLLILVYASIVELIAFNLILRVKTIYFKINKLRVLPNLGNILYS